MPGAVAAAEPSETSLVAACRQGDAHALAALVERYQTDVFGAVLRICRDRDHALELTNSIFYKAYQNFHAFDDTRPLRPWLLRIATNEALNWLRSRRREREHVLDGKASEAALLSVQGGAEPEAEALQLEQRQSVRDALGRLPDHYRTVLTLRFFNDLSYAEIAEITGQEPNTVGVQLLRARSLLRAALQQGDTVVTGAETAANAGGKTR
ncbi:MAG TPA: sigma-70 family RNA polymerase sigma factor [Chloroflexota bacterium]|nr:sigma-70 family RNA polymerase sigma factor [Chloroflexota bacterium]